MDLNVIEYFYVIARTGSVSRAAAELSVEQSTLTRHINRLEESIGARLFHRSGRGMVLNENGTAFFRQAEDVMAALSRARRSAADLAADGPSRIVIAAQPTIAHITFGPLSYALKQEFPRAAIRFVEGLGYHVINMLKDGEVDAALMYQPTQSRIFECEQLLQEDLYCIGPSTGKLRKSALTGEELLQLPLVLPTTAHGLRAWIESLGEELGIKPNIAIECDGATSLTRRLVQSNLGYTLLPLAAVTDELVAGKLKAYRIKHPKVTRSIVLTTANNRPQINSFGKVIQLLKKTVGGLVKNGQWPGAGKLS